MPYRSLTIMTSSGFDDLPIYIVFGETNTRKQLNQQSMIGHRLSEDYFSFVSSNLICCKAKFLSDCFQPHYYYPQFQILLSCFSAY